MLDFNPCHAVSLMITKSAIGTMYMITAVKISGVIDVSLMMRV